MKILKAVEAVKRDTLVLPRVVNLSVQSPPFTFIFNSLKEKTKNMAYRTRGHGLSAECQRKVKHEIILDKAIEETSSLIKPALPNHRQLLNSVLQIICFSQQYPDHGLIFRKCFTQSICFLYLTLNAKNQLIRESFQMYKVN